jgi:hypothetical protein
MPHHYVLHKLKAHPKHRHLKKHLSHFSKSHPKSHGGALVHSHHPHRVHHNYPPDSGMHTMASGLHHRKKLHPLKFKI